MAYGFNTKHDIERVVRSVLVSERIKLNERGTGGGKGHASPQCVYDRIYGMATGAFSDSDLTISIDNVKILRGANPLDDPTSTTETVTGHNVTGFSGDDDAIVKLEWNITEGRWEIYDTPCPE